MIRHHVGVFFALLLLPGCALLPFGQKPARLGGVYRENLDQNRLVDLVIVRKLTGQKKLFFFNEYTPFLEGYIRGAVVDYDDAPIEGIVVRVTDKGKDVPGFDPGVSDANGVYRVRFSLPIKKNVVDVKGAIAYNPPWQQQLDLLGAALEPQTKETQFRLFYDRKLGIIGIGEDIPKTITRKVTGSLKEILSKEEKSRKERGLEPAGRLPSPPAAKTPPPAPKKQEDFFGGFGDFGN